MKFFEEFRKFAVKGNVVDMAVGIVVGVAFNAIVNSLINDVVMPPVGLYVGGDEFKYLKWVLQEASTTEDGVQLAEVAIRYGAFINTIVHFFVIAISAFVVVKTMNRMIHRRESGSAGAS